MAILALVAAIIVPVNNASPAQAARGPVAEATATVRIVSGERISAGRLPEAALVRDTQVRGQDGSEKPARLVEFP